MRFIGKALGCGLTHFGIRPRPLRDTERGAVHIQAANLSKDPRLVDLAAQIEDQMDLMVRDSGPIEPVLRYLLSTGGKRLRPLLVIWTAEACANSGAKDLDEKAVLEVAAAFELVHLASLVHDDIIDGACLRRGFPAAHTVWGIHSAVLAGDYLFTRANRIALRYADLGIASIITQAVEMTCQGEIAQDSRLFDPDMTEREYLSCICRKTATLIGAACQAGAVLGGTEPQVEESMLRFGIELGCAFQIADDIIDLVSPSETSGKPQCNDLRRGVPTLPLILAMRSPAGGALRRVYAQRRVTEQDIPAIREVCEKEGCVDRARDTARLLAKSAESRLDLLRPSAAKLSLKTAARSVADRLS